MSKVILFHVNDRTELSIFPSTRKAFNRVLKEEVNLGHPDGLRMEIHVLILTTTLKVKSCLAIVKVMLGVLIHEGR